jgi:diguanylate cyclase (GGDEF)-like protein
MTDNGNLLPKYIMMQKALLSSLHLKDVLDAAVLQFMELAAGAKVAIFLSDNESLALKLMASKGYSESSTEQLKVVPFAAESLLKNVVQKRIASCAQEKTAPEISASVIKREGSVGQIALPLIASNLLIGGVLIDINKGSVFHEVDFLQDCASIAAMAIANSVLFGRSEYERERLNTLYKTSCSLSGSVLSVSEVLQIAADTALVAANTPNCAILILDETRRAFDLAAFKGLEGSSMGDFDLNVQNTIAGSCITNKKTEYIMDAANVQRGLPKAAGGSPFGSILALPLMHQREPLGAMLLFSTDRRAFHREQIELLDSLGTQVGTALHVALTHETAASRSIEDAHTGLSNRWHFDDSLVKEVERSQRHRREFALLLVDVDHLAQINEHLGQQKGDEAIRHVARTIKTALRDIDIPCRYGGEEFGIILPETPYQNSYEVAERLRQKIRANVAPGVGTITVSIGLAAFPHNGTDAQSLLLAAQQALDVAKFQGRDRIKVAESGNSTSGPISWEELASQAKLSVISERQSNLQSKLTAAAEYANWMRSGSISGSHKRLTDLPKS